MQTSSLMEKVIKDIAWSQWIDLKVVGARIDLQMDKYLPLIIETTQERQIQVAHFFEENGDIVPDPCITFVVVSENQWVPIDKTESYGGLQSFGYADVEKVIVTDIQGQHELANFANQWAEDIRFQKWSEVADAKVSGPAECRLEPEEYIPF